MIKNLLFDWSGTLVDDLPPTLHATNVVLQQHGAAAMDREEFRRRFRLPYPEFYDEVLPGVPVASLEDLFRDSFRRSPVPVTPLPGAMETLAWCQEAGLRCFVLSSMDPGLLARQAESFELAPFFEEVYSGIIDKRDEIGRILERHELAPTETAFVGDMLHDIATARAGNVASYMMETGYDPPERLREAEPDAMFANLDALVAYLKEVTA